MSANAEDGKVKVFAFANTKDIREANRQQWVLGMAIREDGVVVAQHIHSSLSWCRADLSLEGLRGPDILAACPEGCEVEFVEPEDVVAHEGLKVAFEKNAQLRREHEEKERTVATIEKESA